MRVRLVTACGADRLEEIVDGADTVIVPLVAAKLGTVDDIKYYKPSWLRLEEEAAQIRRRYFTFRGEYDHNGLRIYREVVS